MTVFERLCQNMVSILPSLANRHIKPNDSMRDLCPNSIDRMDVLVQTLEDLQLVIPFTQLYGPKNLQELADLLQQKLDQQSLVA